MDAELDRERNYESRGEEDRNGVGRMQLLYWKEETGKEREKRRKIKTQRYKEQRIFKERDGRNENSKINGDPLGTKR